MWLIDEVSQCRDGLNKIRQNQSSKRRKKGNIIRLHDYKMLYFLCNCVAWTMGGRGAVLYSAEVIDGSPVCVGYQSNEIVMV